MKLRTSLCTLVLVSFLVPQTARAQESGITWQFTPWIGTAFSNGDVGAATSDGVIDVQPGQINNAPAYGVFAGVRLGGHLMIEGLLSFMPSTLLLDTTLGALQIKQGYDLNIVTFGGNLGWAFSTSKTAVVPYLSAGAGGMSFRADESVSATFSNGGMNTTELMINFGGGLGIPISETVQLRLDLRDYVASTGGEFSVFPSSETSTLNTVILSAGVTVHSP